ncbi:MAG: hypothetical protein FWF06_00450 [Symbiobacteriaceae bacterium]|nr:hypothetical protein [Symbiobacteriaceae bacterium]
MYRTRAFNYRLFLCLVLTLVTAILTPLQGAEAAVPVTAGSYLLQLRGTLVRSQAGDTLVEALWLTEALTPSQAKSYALMEIAMASPNLYRLQALAANKAVLGEITFYMSRQTNLIQEEMVLPPGTAYVELRAPDGSLVANGAQSWQSNEAAPRLYYLDLTPLDPTNRSILLRWASVGSVDGYAVWYTPDDIYWYFMTQTTATAVVVELTDLPGGQLAGGAGKFAVIACNGLTNSILSESIIVPWLLPQIYISGVQAGELLTYRREETIDLVAAAWDDQERWGISDRIIWRNSQGQVVASGSQLLLAASRFPVGRYQLQAVTMNERMLFAAVEFGLEITTVLSCAELGIVPDYNREGELLLPLRQVMEGAGWGVIFDSERGEIHLNGYFEGYIIYADGTLWQDGFFLGLVPLIDIANQRWVTTAVLEQLGFNPTWDDTAQELTLTPR